MVLAKTSTESVRLQALPLPEATQVRPRNWPQQHKFIQEDTYSCQVTNQGQNAYFIQAGR